LRAARDCAPPSDLPPRRPVGPHPGPAPARAQDDTGLGGGIAFATSPNFCAELIDNFREDDGSFGLIKFVTCEDINDALNRAMATWSANHPYIDFYNVTDECVAEGNGKACSVAELYIDSMRPAKGSEDVAAFVLHNPKGFGRDYSHDTTASNWHTGVRTPSGEMVDDWVIQFATLTFHSHSCWYLDASFCSRFRDINERVNVTLLMQVRARSRAPPPACGWPCGLRRCAALARRNVRRVVRSHSPRTRTRAASPRGALSQFVIWGCWCCSFVVLFGRLAQTCSYVFRDGVRRGVRRSVRVQAREITRTYLMLFLLITPPIIWYGAGASPALHRASAVECLPPCSPVWRSPGSSAPPPPPPLLRCCELCSYSPRFARCRRAHLAGIKSLSPASPATTLRRRQCTSSGALRARAICLSASSAEGSDTRHTLASSARSSHRRPEGLRVRIPGA
jgi:hypothetical protein